MVTRMKEIHFVLRRGDEVQAVLKTRGGAVPPMGKTYMLHPRGDGEPGLWRVVGVHGELWPGPHDIVLGSGRPLSKVDPDEYHEGDVTVVFLEPDPTAPVASVDP